MCQNNNLQLNQKHQQTGQPVQILQNEEAPLQQNQVLQEELQMLQAEQAAPEQETRLEEAQANVTLVAEVRQELETAQAVQTAEGAPVQEQEPAPSTWKERRTERKKAEAAKKVCPVGTATTYDMVEQLKERRKMTGYDAKPYLERAAREGVDRKYLLSFCQGYRKNRFGSPASEEDKKKKAQDQELLRDFCSGSPSLRRQHLKRIVNEIISTPFSLEMFTTRNLRQNLAELKCLGERLVCIQNLKNDCPEFFERLQAEQPLKWKQLNAAETLGGAFVPLLEAHCRKNGVNTETAGYLGSEQDNTIKDGQESLGTLTETFQTALREFRRINVYGEYEDELTRIRGYAAVDEEEHEKLKQMAGGDIWKLRQADQVFERLKEDPRLEIPPEELAPEAVKKAKLLLVPDEAHAEENIRTIRLMQELEQNHDQKPSVDLYARTRAFTAPLVKRVMDCYLDYMLELPVGSLVTSHAEELEKLARESRLASEFLKLQHPIYTAQAQSRLMLQDELLGSKVNEFTYRCEMVQALAKKARMYSLLSNGTVENMRIGEEYLTEEERLEAGAAPELMIRQKILDAEEEMLSAKKKYQDVHTPGTEEFKKWYRDIRERGRLAREVIDIKYEPVLSEFAKRETPEIRHAMERLQDEQYYSLEYTQKEVEALGMTENVGEAMFRSFEAFLKKEATKELLSPEEFRRMALDLGAGAGMHCGTWESRKIVVSRDENGEERSEKKIVQHPGTPKEELEPAIEKNRAGLAVFKQIMRAQYDMITDKYGLSFENLEVGDLVKYCSDIFRDFGESQLEDKMVTRFPGFLDLNDEKDKLLFYQVKYYSNIASQVNSLYTNLSPEVPSPIQSKEDIWELMKYSLDDQTRDAREYLMEHVPGFSDRTRVDPYAKVRKSE